MSRFAAVVVCATLLTGCGGSLASGAEVSDSSTPPGVDASIDAAPPESELLMTCPKHGAPLAIRLPCLLGMNLAGDPAAPGLHVLECDLRDAPVRTVMGIMVPLADLPGMLNREVLIPFSNGGAPPGYALTLVGTAVFTDVDPKARTFSGRLLKAVVRSGTDGADLDACTIVDQPFWAAPGGFL
jgi:hypothetical protein